MKVKTMYDVHNNKYISLNDLLVNMYEYRDRFYSINDIFLAKYGLKTVNPLIERLEALKEEKG